VEFIRQQQGAEILAELQKEKEQRIRVEQRFNRFLKTALMGSFAAIVGLAGLTWQAESQRREANNQRKQSEKFQVGQSDALSRYSDELFNQGKVSDALIAGLQAGIPLKRVGEAKVDGLGLTRVRVANSLWQGLSGMIATLKGHDSRVNSVSFSPDGKTLASGSDDKTIKLWNLATGNQITTLKGHDSWVNSVSFSPDGKTLASGSTDKTIKLWNLATGNQITTLKGHDSWVNSVSFSPDGKTLASGSTDKTIKLWNLYLDHLLVRGCDWVGGYLKNNPNVSESDRTLCDDIPTQK
jgi:WD40 repeat protein